VGVLMMQQTPYKEPSQEWLTFWSLAAAAVEE
jgi:hypothetical protein